VKNGPWSASLERAAASLPVGYLPQPMKGFHGETASRTIPPLMCPTFLAPLLTHTHSSAPLTSPSWRVKEAGAKRLPPKQLKKHRGEISLRWREKGSRRSVLEHPTPSSSCASWELAMYLPGCPRSVHSGLLHPPVSGDVPWCPSLCAAHWGTGRHDLVRRQARAAPGTGSTLSHRLPGPKLLCTHFCFSFCVLPPHPPCYS